MKHHFMLQVIEEVNRLLEAGVDINGISINRTNQTGNQTALHIASALGYVEVVHRLLHQPNIHINPRDGNGHLFIWQVHEAM